MNEEDDDLYEVATEYQQYEKCTRESVSHDQETKSQVIGMEEEISSGYGTYLFSKISSFLNPEDDPK
jgi:hypothetical protein